MFNSSAIWLIRRKSNVKTARDPFVRMAIVRAIPGQRNGGPRSFTGAG
jgi:hypothetical protein